MRFAGVGLVMLAAICWGITGGIADILMSKGWDPLVISFYRGAVGFLGFLYGFLCALDKIGSTHLNYISGPYWRVLV